MTRIRENSSDPLAGGGLLAWFNDHNIPIIGDELDLREEGGDLPPGKLDGIWRVVRRRIGKAGEDEQKITLYVERVA